MQYENGHRRFITWGLSCLKIKQPPGVGTIACTMYVLNVIKGFPDLGPPPICQGVKHVLMVALSPYFRKYKTT